MKRNSKIAIIISIIILIGAAAAGQYFFFNESKAASDDYIISADLNQSGKHDSKRLEIIMYHGISENEKGTGMYVISVKTLEDDIKWLTDNGYRSVSVSDIINYVDGKSELPEKPVMLTFDDGMKNNFSLALPVIEKYNQKGVFSVVGEYCDGKYGGYTDWDELYGIRNNPHAEIQNHSYTMHRLDVRNGSGRKDNEGFSEYIRAFTYDTSLMQDRLESCIGVRPECYTYPFGVISEGSTEALISMGFRASLTCYEKTNIIEKGNSESLFLLNRYNRPQNISTSAFMKKVFG